MTCSDVTKFWWAARSLLAACGLAVLAGCAAPSGPAPVVDRSPAPDRPVALFEPPPVSRAPAPSESAPSAVARPVIRPATSGAALPPAVASSAPALRPPAGPPGQFHTIRRGDTLYSIAQMYSIDLRELVAWNRIVDPNLIQIDQVLRLTPPERGSASPDGALAMPVQSGVVEQRTLATQPSTGLGSPAVASSAPVSSAPLLAGPSGERRPFSDATLTEMTRGSRTGTAVSASSSPPPSSALSASPALPAPPASSMLPVAPAAPPALAPTPPAAAVDGGIPWRWPASGRVIDGFSEGRNKGIDIAGREGDPVFASADGRVVYAGNGLRGYGNLVIVKHNDEFLSAYAHNRALLVKQDQAVRQGQRIAEMGDSDSERVMLHFEIRREGKPVDPMHYLPPR